MSITSNQNSPHTTMQHHDHNVETFKELEIVNSKIAARQESPGEFPDQLRVWETRREEIRNQLLLANQGLVRSLAGKYMGNGLDSHDLVQEGVIGLINAIERFDYRKGCKLSTYAQKWILQAMMRALSKHSRTIRIPEEPLSKMRKLKRVTERIRKEMECEPTPEDIAWEMNIPVSKVRDLLALEGQTISIYDPIGDSGDATIIDFTADPSEADPGRELDFTLHHKWLMESLETLTEREREVFVLRNGLCNKEARSLVEIGVRFGVCKERIRQIENAAYHKVVGFIRSKDSNGFLKAVKEAAAFRNQAKKKNDSATEKMQLEPKRGVITRKNGKNDNPNHHIWLNNGTWFCKFRVRSADGDIQNINKSLKTHSEEEARIRRDQMMSTYDGPGHDVAA
jgi:RNA polymerase primary sigma factor